MKRQYFYLVKSGILRGIPNDKNANPPSENRPSKNELKNRQKKQKQQQKQRRKQEQKQRQKQKQKREKWEELHSWVNTVLDSVERAKTLSKTKR